MFSAQPNRNRLHHSTSSFASLLSLSLSENSANPAVKNVETKFELQTRAVHDLSELLRLKSLQKEKYGCELSPRSNYYWRHEMVRSFLWMQLNKKKDNPYYNRQALARIVAQSFNKGRYTRRKLSNGKSLGSK